MLGPGLAFESPHCPFTKHCRPFWCLCGCIADTDIESQQKEVFSGVCTLAQYVLTCVAEIRLQEDMDLAPDFFSFFEALTPRLDRDPTLMCISSWNDHGQVRLTSFLPRPLP